MPDLLQTGISLAAIAALVALVWWLGLGPAQPLLTSAQALSVAEELIDGFDAEDAGLDQNGQSALVAGRDGRLMLIKAHGNRWAGRTLGAGTQASLHDESLHIETGEKRFGAVTLALGNDAQSWAKRIERL